MWGRTSCLPAGSARSRCQHARSRSPHICTTRSSWDETDPDARELTMFFNRILLSKCEQLWAYIGQVSPGMRAEIDWAHQMDIPIRFFDADFQEVHPA